MEPMTIDEFIKGTRSRGMRKKAIMAMFDIYRECYASCGVDYDKDIFESGLAFGTTEFYLNYHMPLDLYLEIYGKVCKKHGLTAHFKRILSTTILGGHLPVFKND